jgi:hypothetical protein
MLAYRSPSPVLTRAPVVVASILGLTVAVGCGRAAEAQPTSPIEPVSAAAPSAAGPTPYQLGVARDRNVVVVVESTGWTERTEVALELALQRAIPGGQGRCGDDVLPCPHPTPSAPGAFDLATDPLLTDADWARITRADDYPTLTGAPTQLLACIDVSPGPQATDVRAAAYLAPTHPEGSLNEFVLRYPDEAGAGAVVASLREQFIDCTVGTASGGGVSVVLHEHRASDRDGWWTVDEAFVGDRTSPGRGQITGG